MKSRRGDRPIDRSGVKPFLAGYDGRPPDVESPSVVTFRIASITNMKSHFWRGRRVLITGHTGFKGAWLCLLLSRLGAHTSGYALAPPTTPSLFALAQVADAVDSTLGDVRDLDKLTRHLANARPEFVIHMAAQSVVLDSYEDPATTYSTNVLGTVNVLEAIRRSGCRAAVVNVTTDKCYQNRGWVWGYRESDALGGRDPYSSSKACAEFVAQAYLSSYFPPASVSQHGVVIASARAGNVIGGGDWTPHQLVPSAIGAFTRGVPAALRHPTATRPWQHVLDCLRGYLMLAEYAQRAPGTAIDGWNFGPSAGDVLTVAKLTELLAARWNVHPAWTKAVAPTRTRNRSFVSTAAGPSATWDGAVSCRRRMP